MNYIQLQERMIQNFHQHEKLLRKVLAWPNLDFNVHV